MGKISIVKCDNYEIAQVRKAVREAVDSLGGMNVFVRPGERVLIKVNLLMKRKPEKATTTHPAVARAVAELVAEAGGEAIIGDSPGGYHFFNEKTLESVYDTCGMKDAANKSGAKLSYNTDIVDVPYPEGKIIKNIKAIRPVLEVDKIINIPKIKTHMMTVYSGAVKNLFGIIPGSYKAEYHLRFEDVGNFADLLIDLCLFANPVLTIMDAVIGMEGYGPTNGHPKKVELVIAGSNPFELDLVATSIIGLKPGQVPTIVKSMERGLCSSKFEDIEILGQSIKKSMVADYKKPTTQISFNYYNIFIPKFLTKRLNFLIKPNPVIDCTRCRNCRVCEKSCPPKAITMGYEKIKIDYDKCIKCFCCHELCKFDAIRIKRPWFMKFILK